MKCMGCLIIALALAMGATSATAGAAGLSAAPSQGSPGGSVAVSAGGFSPGETVDVHFDSTDLPSARADSDGQLRATVTVPAAAAYGQRTISAAGETSHLVVTAGFYSQAIWTQLGRAANHNATNTLEAAMSPAT